MSLYAVQSVSIYLGCTVLRRGLDKNCFSTTKKAKVIRSTYTQYELSVLSSNMIHIYPTQKITYVNMFTKR